MKYIYIYRVFKEVVGFHMDKIRGKIPNIFTIIYNTNLQSMALKLRLTE